MDEGADFNIPDKSDIEGIQSDPGFQKVASIIICSDLNNYGFQVCQQVEDNIEQPLASSRFEAENGDEDGDEDNNNANDDNDDDTLFGLC
ncbi:MAG TPA: hypothetical protein VKA95_03630 [Nitrososphaeraceae archaeon]|nr:hypothetical protein [Nitrososphaeraceae archaeon]